MKKFVTFLAAATFVVALSSCGGNKAEETTESTEATTEATTEMATDSTAAAATVDTAAAVTADTATAAH